MPLQDESMYTAQETNDFAPGLIDHSLYRSFIFKTIIK